MSQFPTGGQGKTFRQALGLPTQVEASFIVEVHTTHEFVTGGNDGIVQRTNNRFVFVKLVSQINTQGDHAVAANHGVRGNDAVRGVIRGIANVNGAGQRAFRHNGSGLYDLLSTGKSGTRSSDSCSDAENSVFVHDY